MENSIVKFSMANPRRAKAEKILNLEKLNFEIESINVLRKLI
jgi:hypothetical protein